MLRLSWTALPGTHTGAQSFRARRTETQLGVGVRPPPGVSGTAQESAVWLGGSQGPPWAAAIERTSGTGGPYPRGHRPRGGGVGQVLGAHWDRGPRVCSVLRAASPGSGARLSERVGRGLPGSLVQGGGPTKEGPWNPGPICRCWGGWRGPGASLGRGGREPAPTAAPGPRCRRGVTLARWQRPPPPPPGRPPSELRGCLVPAERTSGAGLSPLPHEPQCRAGFRTYLSEGGPRRQGGWVGVRG